MDDRSSRHLHGRQHETLSAFALARYDARTSGVEASNDFEVYLDEHFDNSRMERIYPNAKKVAKAE